MGAVESKLSSGLPVRLDGVSKTYETSNGPMRALEDVSLQVREGEFLSIVGPSGCGKSTLVMMVSGLLPATSGQIFVGDEKVQKPYTKLGFVFQQDVLLDWRTVLQNVLLPVEIKHLAPVELYRQKALDLLKMSGLSGFEQRYPYELSGGMRQRVSICRALVTSPPLLLMDEPFGALDALTREQMNSDLVQIWQQTRNTVLFITHNIDEAVFLADRVLVMSKRPGRILSLLDLKDIPRPRSLKVKDTPEFQKFVANVRDTFVNQGILS